MSEAIRDSVQELLARSALGLLSGSELTKAATAWLSAGIATPAIRELADADDGAGASGPATAIGQVADELSIPRFQDTLEAARWYSARVIRALAEGAVSPHSGARLLWDIALKVEPNLDDLDPFVYAAAEMESRPEDWDHFSSEILKEAKRRARS